MRCELRWRNVLDAQPPKGEPVLVWLSTHVTTDQWEGHKFLRWEGAYWWMPMPPAPTVADRIEQS